MAFCVMIDRNGICRCTTKSIRIRNVRRMSSGHRQRRNRRIIHDAAGLAGRPPISALSDPELRPRHGTAKPSDARNRRADAASMAALGRLSALRQAVSNTRIQSLNHPSNLVC